MRLEGLPAPSNTHLPSLSVHWSQVRCQPCLLVVLGTEHCPGQVPGEPLQMLHWSAVWSQPIHCSLGDGVWRGLALAHLAE
jgi:hypothetical protein